MALLLVPKWKKTTAQVQELQLHLSFYSSLDFQRASP